jgi:N-acetylmuramoyl-L-alanine amidase
VASALLTLIVAGVVSPSLSAEQGVEAAVCFWSVQGPVCVERVVQGTGNGPDAESLMAALLAGPTRAESAQGLWSAIPTGTALEGVEVGADDTVTVRLRVPSEALDRLDHDVFEVIERQVGGTLEPLGWRDLRIQTCHPVDGTFVPLASFLPDVPAPRKETGSGGVLDGAVTYVGQPPASGQGQPQGALTGKTIYVSAGHGWQWNDTLNTWRTQRPPYPTSPYVGPIIEDHNNAEVVNQYLLQYLWNAGAMVIPVRERDMNSAEVVVDGSSLAPGTGYSETGTWATGSSGGYQDGSYRYATSVAGAPTATTVWTATLPADGQYAVYVWYRPGSNRVPDALYAIHHAGGETTVAVDQRYHGDTWHYVGTYGFRAGEEARVTLSNESTVAGLAVIADAVRFGGGTFSSLSGIQTTATFPPNEPWWEVAAFYYTQKMGMDQAPGDVTARPIYARWEHAGTGDDAVYVSWHTNGYSGYQWDHSGTESYVHNGEWLPRTEGSLELQNAIHAELVNDIRAGWDAGWVDRGKKQANLGEVRELWDDDPTVRMPGVLVEVAYHDHPGDTDALKEPTFEMLAARAMLQGIVKYFEQRDGVDLKLPPEPPTRLAVRNVGSGAVRVSWQPSPTDAIGLVGDAATGYRVYTSTDAIGWSNGVAVAGTTVYTLTGFSPGQLVFVRVAATNAGGESFPTEVLGVRVRSDPGVLVVSGFDRLNRTMVIPETDPTEGDNVRMFLARMNSYDYVVQHGQAIAYGFDSASNEAVIDGAVSLAQYDMVDWILGEESNPDKTLDATERGLLMSYLDGGGALFISGAEIGWHLDYVGDDPFFYNNYLHADYAGDDAGTYQVTSSSSSSIFWGLPSFRFDAPGMYDPDYPDQLTPYGAGSTAALSYQGGLGGTAAVQYDGGCERVVYFGFPFETIHSEQRADVMARTLGFLGVCFVPSIDTWIASPVDGSAHNAPPTFGGTAATDPGFSLDRVEVQVRRVDTGQYWTGSGWGAETWLTASGTGTWSYSLSFLSGDGDYSLRARAWTTDPYSETTPAEVTFTYDTIPPTSTVLITPTGGVTVTTPVFALEWQAVPPDGGSPLAYVVKLDGQAIVTTTQPMYTFVGYIPNGPHTWEVQVVDAAGNGSDWVSDAFVTDVHHYWLPVVCRDS